MAKRAYDRSIDLRQSLLDSFVVLENSSRAICLRMGVMYAP